MSRDRDRDEAILSAHERLVEALAADLLGAPDVEILASHTPTAARVAADTLRRRLHRALSAGAAAPRQAAGPPPGAAPGPTRRPEKKP